MEFCAAHSTTNLASCKMRLSSDRGMMRSIAERVALEAAAFICIAIQRSAPYLPGAALRVNTAGRRIDRIVTKSVTEIRSQIFAPSTFSISTCCSKAPKALASSCTASMDTPSIVCLPPLSFTCQE